MANFMRFLALTNCYSLKIMIDFGKKQMATLACIYKTKIIVGGTGVFLYRENRDRFVYLFIYNLKAITFLKKNYKVFETIVHL